MNAGAFSLPVVFPAFVRVSGAFGAGATGGEGSGAGAISS